MEFEPWAEARSFQGWSPLGEWILAGACEDSVCFAAVGSELWLLLLDH
jgi:hypothetical protein